jgi:hypothetical protein
MTSTNTKLISLKKRLDSIRKSMDVLKEFDKRIGEISTINIKLAGVYLQAFISAQDRAGTLFAGATKLEIDAKAIKDEMEAIAFMDKSLIYFTSNNIKATDALRKAFVATDPDFQEAIDLFGYAVALVKTLSNKLRVYSSCEFAIKKLAWGNDHTGIL